MQPDVICTAMHSPHHPCWSAVLLCHMTPGLIRASLPRCWGTKGSHKFGPGVAFVPDLSRPSRMCARHFAVFGQPCVYSRADCRESGARFSSQLGARFLSTSIIINSANNCQLDGCFPTFILLRLREPKAIFLIC
jgi:hypothetical protein